MTSGSVTERLLRNGRLRPSNVSGSTREASAFHNRDKDVQSINIQTHCLHHVIKPSAFDRY